MKTRGPPAHFLLSPVTSGWRSKWIFQDRATAGEIVAQTVDTLGNKSALAKSSR